MANEQVASEPESPTPAAKTQPPANPVRRLTLIVMAIGAVLFLYGIAAASRPTRRKPSSRRTW
jgi:hypothetical protein